MKLPHNGDLKVWWTPQIPMKPFEVEVESITQAKFLLDVLANYDIFQFKNRVKGDYSNAGGLMIYEHGEWVDWEDEEGNSIDETP